MTINGQVVFCTSTNESYVGQEVTKSISHSVNMVSKYDISMTVANPKYRQCHRKEFTAEDDFWQKMIFWQKITERRRFQQKTLMRSCSSFLFAVSLLSPFA